VLPSKFISVEGNLIEFHRDCFVASNKVYVAVGKSVS